MKATITPLIFLILYLSLQKAPTESSTYNQKNNHISNITNRCINPINGKNHIYRSINSKTMDLKLKNYANILQSGITTEIDLMTERDKESYTFHANMININKKNRDYLTLIISKYEQGNYFDLISTQRISPLIFTYELARLYRFKLCIQGLKNYQR